MSDVSFDVRRGETLGLVGESGCGKSTTGRAIMMLPRPTSGTVSFDGVDLTGLEGQGAAQPAHRAPDDLPGPASRRSTLDARCATSSPRASRSGVARADSGQVDEVLDAVGLDPEAVGDRRPHEFSGGQCQRIAIARALLLDPTLIVCDEPVSALDVSVQAQILNLLEDMRERYQLTLLFIAHDLAVVKNVSDRIAVMYLGKLCEVAPADELYRDPQHPYTDALLEAVPVPDPDAPIIPMEIAGDLPSPLDPPSGCRFRTRCPRAQPRCASEEPVMRAVAPDHYVACHFPGKSEVLSAVHVG